MSRNRPLQPEAPSVEQPTGDHHVPDQLGDPLSPWLTAEEAARYLRVPTLKAFYKWVAENPSFPRGKRGRVFLFERRILDAYVRGDLWTKRRAG